MWNETPADELSDDFTKFTKLMQLTRFNDMGDMGEMFNAMKEDSKQRRASHRENSPKLLEEARIPFESKNGGAHLIVEGSECYIDFWPGTGKWISRNGKKGFGVRNLINFIKA